MQNKIKLVPFEWADKEKLVSLEVSRYHNNDKLCIKMIRYKSFDAYDHFMNVTVNFVPYPLELNEAFINSDFSDDIINFLIKNELGELLPYTEQSGYDIYYAFAFNLDKPAEFDPEGIAEFKGVHNI